MPREVPDDPFYKLYPHIWDRFTNEEIVERWENGTLGNESLLTRASQEHPLRLIGAYASERPHAYPPSIDLIENVARELVDIANEHTKPGDTYAWRCYQGHPDPGLVQARRLLAAKKAATEHQTLSKPSGMRSENDLDQRQPDKDLLAHSVPKDTDNKTTKFSRKPALSVRIVTPVKKTPNPTPTPTPNAATGPSQKGNGPALYSSTSNRTPTPTSSVLGKHARPDATLFIAETSPTKSRRVQNLSATGYKGTAMLAPPRKLAITPLRLEIKDAVAPLGSSSSITPNFARIGLSDIPRISSPTPLNGPSGVNAGHGGEKSTSPASSVKPAPSKGIFRIPQKSPPTPLKDSSGVITGYDRGKSTSTVGGKKPAPPQVISRTPQNYLPKPPTESPSIAGSVKPASPPGRRPAWARTRTSPSKKDSTGTTSMSGNKAPELPSNASGHARKVSFSGDTSSGPSNWQKRMMLVTPTNESKKGKEKDKNPFLDY